MKKYLLVYLKKHIYRPHQILVKRIIYIFKGNLVSITFDLIKDLVYSFVPYNWPPKHDTGASWVWNSFNHRLCQKVLVEVLLGPCKT